MTKLSPETVLQEFLQAKGFSLAPYGSAEFALDLPNAIEFIDMLDELGRSPLGIEVWRRIAGEPAIQSLHGWYSESSNPHTNIASAREFIHGPLALADDLYCIQYNGPPRGG
jgi:hypothetical protein